MRTYLLVALAGIAGQVAFHPAPAVSGPAGAPVAARRVEQEPNTLPRVMTHHYRMAGRVRPLLFWIGRDNVGLASVVWRAGGDGSRGYELLIGTDPARAPRGLNRWGYIAEQTSGAEGSLLALMTQAAGGSYEDAERQAATTAGDLHAIRSEVRHGTARWQTARIRPAAPFSVFDARAAIVRARDDAADSPLREMAVASATRSGFLVAVAELVESVVDGGAAPTVLRSVPYVFGQRTYHLRVVDARTTRLRLGPDVVEARHARFEIHTLATGARTRFEMTLGTRAHLTGVPLMVAWQPRWWLKLELHLDESSPRGTTGP